MECNTGILALITILLLYLLFVRPATEFFTLKSIKSGIDGEKYRVVSKYSDRDIAASHIGAMNIFTIDLIKKLKEVYSTSSDTNTNEYHKGQDIINILLERFDKKSLKENDSDDPDKTSYTTNKGKVIALCLREKQSGKNKLHDLDLIKFVFLHELAHIVSVSYIHDAEFWVNFKFLLQFCSKYNLYNSIDYKKNNVVYCGLLVEYNPVYDDIIPSYFK